MKVILPSFKKSRFIFYDMRYFCFMEKHYNHIPYTLSEQEHKYGNNIHLISDPVLITLLARLCSQETIQPQINELASRLYESLVEIVINCEFPKKNVHIETRMHAVNREGVYVGEIIDPDTKVVVVDLARAGMLPSLVSYNYLNTIMNPHHVRQDHIFINRETDTKEHVIGTKMSGCKIGGSVNDSIIIFPDPMGATGSSMSAAISMYKNKIGGAYKKLIALNLIITPEYIKRMKEEYPDLQIYALRLDRGLSPKEIFDTIPGTYIDKEKGLNDKQYIVPGGGGFGEIMNNSFV